MGSPTVPIDFNQDMVQIENNLYLANLETACNGQYLNKFKIKKVVSLFNSQINDKYKVNGIQYKYINVWDTETEDIISYFPECFQFIYGGQLKSIHFSTKID